MQGEKVHGRCSPSEMMTTGVSGSSDLTFRGDPRPEDPAGVCGRGFTAKDSYRRCNTIQMKNYRRGTSQTVSKSQ